MSSSAASDTDEQAYVSEKQRKASQRREALARLKDASSSRAARQPRFLGAVHSDGDDASGGEVDFEQWERRDLAKRKRAPGGDLSAPSRSDTLLSGAFDDLFDLGENGGATGDGTAAADVDGTGAEGIDVEGGITKKRRIVAKLDETRLLGPSGFPKLRDNIKKVKIKGKGHEMQDLKRVLTVYQLWSHQMYPKTNLRDTLQVVEKLCHKRTVQRALKQYRDEEKHGKAQVDEAGEVDAFADLDFLKGGQNGAGRQADTPAPVPDRVQMMQDAGFEMDDDFFGDEEALLAEIDAQAQNEAPPVGVPDTSASDRAAGDAEGMGDMDEDDEAEAALREAEALLM
ncbi:swi3 domain-containing protein [Rhodotorula toruloides]|uniref:Chromosome segregation in meiosis protein n=1 Tax=Rhodotorula toruloides TaxID=5286 RepID=A0A511KGF9_RHOTO|nr:swi3 domain-containing protein [Rhodotorula toruloides]